MAERKPFLLRIDPTVLDGFERAARASGWRGGRNMTDDWRNAVGYDAQYAGADPTWVGHQAERILAALGYRTGGRDLERYRRRRR